MPCWEVNTISLKFSVKSKDRLIETLKELGYVPEVYGDMVRAGDMEFDLERGEVEIESRTRAYDRANEVKRKYTELAVRDVAKKKRWAFKMMEQNKMRLMRQ